MVDRLIDGAGLAFRYVVNDVGYGDRMAKDITTGKTSIIAGMSAMVHGVIDNLKFAYKKVLDKQIIFRMQYQMRNGRFWDPNFGFVDRCINTGTNDGKLDYAQTLASQDFLAKAGPFGQTVDYCAQTGGPCGGFFSIRILRNNIVDLQTVHIPLTKDDFGKLLQLWQDKRGLSPVQVVDGSVLGQQLQIDDQDKAIGLKDVYDGLQAVLPEDRKQELADYFPKFETEMNLVKPGQFNPGVIWPRIDLGIISGGAGIGMGDVHLGSGHEAVNVTEVPVYALPVVMADVQPHSRGGVETVIQDWVELVKPQERKSVKGVKVGDTEVIMENLPVGGQAEILVQPHPRGGVEEVVGEKVVASQVMRLIPVGDEIRVAALQPVADRQVVEEVITENTEVTEGTEEVVVPTVTRMIPVDKVIEDTVSHLRGVISVKVVGATEIELVKLLQPVAVIQAEKHQEHSVMQPHPRGGVEVVAEKIVVSTVTRMIPVNEVVSVTAEVSGVSDAEPAGEVITEGTHLRVSGFAQTADLAVSRAERFGGQAEVVQKVRKLFFSDFSFNSVFSVIKEVFSEQIIKHKRYQSVKAKVIGLQRQVANILADQLMGRNTDEPVLGWLVHGWAMMQFDGIEEKQKMKRFRLSPVRIWADRVTRVARRVKDKFVRTYFRVYKQLFAAI